MNNDDVISLYETVAVITSEMVVAARSGNWEQVAVLETRCASQVAILKTDQPQALLSGERRLRKVQIIQKILANDREIRTIAEPWMATLSKLINSTGTERKLSQAYSR